MKLLFVDCCVSQRGKDSRTLALAERYIAAFRKKHPEAEVERVEVGALELAPFTAETLTERDALAQKGEFSAPVFALARQFAAADFVVVAAPYWDLSYPAQLKLYIEHISANGLCYHYDQTGCHGDCRAEKLVYLTSGGDFEREHSIGVLHWEQLCAMFGIRQFGYVFADGLDIDPDKTADILKKACEKAEDLA